MCDVSYTFMNACIFRNKFTRISKLPEVNGEGQITERAEIIQVLDRFESEEVVEDFLQLHSDLPGPSLDELSNMSCADIVSALMDQKCGWSIIYYSAKLHKCFIGRDIFGRQSLLFSSDGSSITVSQLARPTNMSWTELPHGEISVFSISDIFSTVHIYSYFKKDTVYVTDCVWRSLFNAVILQIDHVKDDLITVSRTVSPITSSHNELIDHLTMSIKSLLPPALDSVGVCFSGGVDSLLITHLLLSIIPNSLPIHLINVAFGDDPLFISRASDRSRSIDAYLFLKERFPNHDLHLILVDVSSSSLESARLIHIPLASNPSSTVLDESIAAVLYFAFRGIGKDYDTGQEIRCGPIRIMGSGADEIFAGYARHRHRYEKDGNSGGIAEECEMELRRLGLRNGGRDARVALIQGVVINIETKTQMMLPRGIGEKWIIRQCLRSLNAPHCAPKQAMQFGSGMVKMEKGKNQKGSDQSSHLQL